MTPGRDGIRVVLNAAREPSRFFRPFLAAVACAFAVLASASGCGPEQPSDDVAVLWTVQPDPPRVGPTRVTVALADSAGRPIANARVDLEATMTHPGMRPERSPAEEIEPGRYRADLDLSMGGDWVLLMEADLPDGRRITRQRDLSGVGGP